MTDCRVASSFAIQLRQGYARQGDNVSTLFMLNSQDVSAPANRPVGSIYLLEMFNSSTKRFETVEGS